VIVSDSRQPILGDQIKELRVGRNSAILGPTMGIGTLQAAGPGGFYLFAVSYNVGTRNAGYWKVFMARRGKPGRWLVLRSPTTRDGSPEPVAGWGPGGRVAVLLGSRIIFDAGTATARSLRGLKGYSYLTGGGPDGMLALLGSGRIALVSASGHVAAIRTRWVPLCFSPDQRNLLVVNAAWNRLALMSIKTGAVSPLGSVSGHFQPAAWVSP
jgi:hypothetical protein